MLWPATSLPEARDTRERILVATLRVIVEVGVDNLTHRRVAEAAGVSLGSTTRYSTDRMDLVRQAAEFYVDWAKTESARFTAPGPPADVAELVERMVSILQPTALLAAEYELLVLAHRDEALAKLMTAAVADIDAPTEEYLARLGVSDPAAGARLVRAVVRGSGIEYLSETEPRDELAARLTQVIESMPKTESA